jgi:hypothetical protein
MINDPADLDFFCKIFNPERFFAADNLEAYPKTNTGKSLVMIPDIQEITYAGLTDTDRCPGREIQKSNYSM